MECDQAGRCNGKSPNRRSLKKGTAVSAGREAARREDACG